MSLHFTEENDAVEDAAQIEIAGMMDVRRRVLREQMIADEVRNELCNAVIEWRGRLNITNDMIRSLRDSDDPNQRNLHNYISRLESFQSVFWCQNCGKMASVGDKPDDCPDIVQPTRTIPTSSAAQLAPKQVPHQSTDFLDQNIPDFLSMDEITIILRGLQQEARKMRDFMNNHSARPVPTAHNYCAPGDDELTDDNNYSDSYYQHPLTADMILQ